jgi:hypothetical protein
MEVAGGNGQPAIDKAKAAAAKAGTVAADAQKNSLSTYGNQAEASGDNGFGGSRSDNSAASSYASSSSWQYSGLPSFFDLSDAALESAEDSPPMLRFSIRLTRRKMRPGLPKAAPA